jgi:hypothetical protein
MLSMADCRADRRQELASGTLGLLGSIGGFGRTTELRETKRGGVGLASAGDRWGGSDLSEWRKAMPNQSISGAMT